MDSFIQFLFYFIIIIAFLNSVFGKKKRPVGNPPPKEQVPESYEPQTDYSSAQTSPQEESNFEISQEIESLFRKEIPPDTATPVVTAPAVEIQELVAAVPDDNQAYIDERAKEFEKQLNSREYSSDWFNKNIRNKLQNPQSLKDYIIISEILGKPKAFE
jgi:hypothetical protein